MLILTRKINEAVIVDSQYRIVLKALSGRKVTLSATIMATGQSHIYHISRSNINSKAILTKDITITLVECTGRSVRLGFDTPPAITVDREEIYLNKMREREGAIFVFGSNEAGIHGAGAALIAKQQYGAESGVGAGRTGSAYAIPTKDEGLKSLPLDRIDLYVEAFLDYTDDHPDEKFFVTRVGCGLAGYADRDIAPMFYGAPDNCILPMGW